MTNLLRYKPDDPAAPWNEDDLQLAVVQMLRRAGISVVADQNAGRRSWKEGARRKALGMTAGEPDLRLYLTGGRLVSIEMKAGAGSVSKEQKARHDVLACLGFPVHVVKAKTPADACAQVVAILSQYGYTLRLAA